MASERVPLKQHESQELIDQLFCAIAKTVLSRVGEKLRATGLAFPYGFAVMNAAVLDDLCCLGALHRYDFPATECFPMGYYAHTCA
jgi:hypothetical protein